MSDYIDNSKSLKFSVLTESSIVNISKVCRALSVPDRLRIMALLSVGPLSLYELSIKLDIPISSVSYHIDILNDAGLVFTTYKPTPKGHAKVCSKAVLSTVITFDDIVPSQDTASSVEIPVGLYSECLDITAPCGMLSESGRLGQMDSPAEFYSPQRTNAELLWFQSGYLSYCFPPPESGKHIASVRFSFEICSEATYYNTNWKSDITIHVNGHKVTTYTSPGDFGGRRGNYTPQFWPITSTQYGLLKTLEIRSTGVYLDDQLVNNELALDNLDITSDAPFIKFGLEVKADAEHMGGMNLFGKNFGDHPQAIVMTIFYDDRGTKATPRTTSRKNSAAKARTENQ